MPMLGTVWSKFLGVMFPKGPRFVPPKVSDVPGPNTYNTMQESQLDAYKRGAFLEKTDRFSKEKPSEDRYAILQRKVGDLDKMHSDGKKSHQAEIEHLRLELTRSQKSTADVSERLDKTRKQNEALDVRIQECKKAMLADQAEAKELRAKLRVSEHERMQLSTKQEELVEAKKMLQSLESKRRDELRERDKKILDLEKSVATEKTVRQVAETRLQEIKRKTDEELQESRALSQNLQVQVSDAQHDAQQARSSLSMLENEAALSAEGLVAQLAQYQSLLESVAEEYGRLASVSVPLFVHSRLKSEHATLQLRILRLERKLANSEEQVIELAHLVRQTREENSFLSGRLHDVQDDLVFCSSAFRDVTSTHLRRADESKLQDDLFIIGMDIRDSERQLQHCLVAEQKLVSQFYRIKFDDLLQLYTIVDKALLDEQALVQQHVVDLSTASAAHTSLVSQLDTVQAERDAAQGELRRAITSVKDMRTTRETLEQQLEETKSTMLTQISKSKTALENEREVVHRLTGTVQKSRMAEEGLRAEIEHLTTELTDAERYQEAYYNLLDEVGVLVVRNALAEDEAQRLSKLNAEILGHTNPAQRIMYVDRIRRELAEARHKHLMATRDHDAVLADNTDLRHELDMYKSVAIHVDNKPRTTITRIARPPLANQCLNISTNVDAVKGSTGNAQTLDTISANMTLDEIM